MRQLSPAMLSGASSKVLAAADRARAAAELAQRVLADPAARARYDRQAGLRSSGTGLTRPAAMPSEQGLDASLLAVSASLGAALGALDALASWLAPGPAPLSGRVVVPDVRGLFSGPCLSAAGLAGLRLKTVRLTENPMPVEGLVVGQSPAQGSKVRRSTVLTVQVWHPAARPVTRRYP
jgi:hypothetical protein